MDEEIDGRRMEESERNERSGGNEFVVVEI